MVFLKSSLGVSKVQPALKTVDSDNQQTDNKILGVIWMFFLYIYIKESGENDCFSMALMSRISLWWLNGSIHKERNNAKWEGIGVSSLP